MDQGTARSHSRYRFWIPNDVWTLLCPHIKKNILNVLNNLSVPCITLGNQQKSSTTVRTIMKNNFIAFQIVLDMILYDMVWHDIWCDVMWRVVTWHDMTWYDTIYDMIHCRFLYLDHATWIMISWIIAWHGMTWRGVAWRGMAWHGIPWHGMVCYGICYGIGYGICYGTVWYGTLSVVVFGSWYQSNLHVGNTFWTRYVVQAVLLKATLEGRHFCAPYMYISVTELWLLLEQPLMPQLMFPWQLHSHSGRWWWHW